MTIKVLVSTEVLNGTVRRLIAMGETPEDLVARFPTIMESLKNNAIKEINVDLEILDDFAKFALVPMISIIDGHKYLENTSQKTSINPTLTILKHVSGFRQEYLSAYYKKHGITSNETHLLNNTPATYQVILDSKEYLMTLVDVLEEIGIYVTVIKGIHRHPKRVLSPKVCEFFVVNDSYCPMLFVNGNLSISQQIRCLWRAAIKLSKDNVILDHSEILSIYNKLYGNNKRLKDEVLEFDTKEAGKIYEIGKPLVTSVLLELEGGLVLHRDAHEMLEVRNYHEATELGRHLNLYG